MTSKAAKRKSRKRTRTISLPGGDTATVPKLANSREPQEDPRNVVINARVRVFGIKADDAPRRSTQADCCIDSVSDSEALRQVWQSILASRRNSRLRNGIPDGPKCSTFTMISDALQTDTSPTIDIRTAEERDTSAKRSREMWDARIKALPATQMIRAIFEAMDGGINGQGGELWADGKPTTRGVVFVAALRVLTN